MTAPLKQHLIDPEICIRCYTCEMTCPIGAIEHDDTNVVVNADICNHCMDCIPVCPTGSIDEWRVVHDPYSLEDQYGWDELPDQADLPDLGDASTEATDDPVASLLAEAHAGTAGKARAPMSAARPAINLHPLRSPISAKVQGNYALTKDPDHDVRHIILDFGGERMPVLEGQTIGILTPGADSYGRAHLPRLYSVSSPRDGERPNYNNLALTVKREPGGLCSNFLCDLEQGQEVDVIGPFGSTFLIPDDPSARLLMICTGTGSAPMRAFTMRRQRAVGAQSGGMTMFFGARAPESLPYFGPLEKVPERLLDQHLVYSRTGAKEYVQDRMLAQSEKVAELMADPATHIYICGLRGMEEGVEAAFSSIAESTGLAWPALKEALCDAGRYHVETY